MQRRLAVKCCNRWTAEGGGGGLQRRVAAGAHSSQYTGHDPQDRSTDNGPVLAYRMPPAHDEVVREILIPFLYKVGIGVRARHR